MSASSVGSVVCGDAVATGVTFGSGQLAAAGTTVAGTPALRVGYTRRAWATQDIPVVPYPLDFAKYQLKGSFTDSVQPLMSPMR